MGLININGFSITGDCTNEGLGEIIFSVTGDSPNWLVTETPTADVNLPTSALTVFDNVYYYSGLSAGSYFLNVYDSTYTNYIVVNFYISSGTCVSINTTDTTCGFDNGGITATTQTVYGNGGTFTLYDINDNFISSGTSVSNEYVFPPVPSGIYYVIANDGGGCTGCSESCVVRESFPFDYGYYVVNDGSCIGSDGSGKIFLTGLSDPSLYTVNWLTSVNGQTGTTVTGLTEGLYNVQVTNQDGCVSTKTITVTGVDPLGIGGFMTYPPTCFTNDGEITIIITGGTAPYYIGCSNGDSAIIFNNEYTFTDLFSGTYNFNIIDAGLCKVSGTTSINTSNSFQVLSVDTTNSMCNDNSGSVTITLIGSGYYTYSLTDSLHDTTSFGPTTNIVQVFDTLSSGDYDLVITDGVCDYETTITIHNTEKFTISAITEDTTCGLNNGSIQLLASTGGTLPYQYEITGFPPSSTTTFNNLASGNYVGTVTDNTGCSQSLNIFVNNSNGVFFDLVVDQPTSGDNGQIETIIYDGTPIFTYDWSPNVNGQTGTTVTGLTAGTYSLEVTDSSGCTLTKTVTLSGTEKKLSYQTYNICNDNFQNTGILGKRGMQQMLTEGFKDLTYDDTGCILNTANFIADVTVDGENTQQSFYVSSGLTDYPSDYVWGETLTELLQSYSGISKVEINYSTNEIKIYNKCVEIDGCQPETIYYLSDANIVINLKLEYNISCQQCITTPTPTPTQTLTQTPTQTQTQTPTQTPTQTLTQTPTPTQTQTPTPTQTLTQTPTQTQTPTLTPTQTLTQTPTPTQTETQILTPTPTPTPTQTETQTPTPTPTQTETQTPTPTPTQTETQTPTPTPTQTPTPTYPDTEFLQLQNIIGTDPMIVSFKTAPDSSFNINWGDGSSEFVNITDPPYNPTFSAYTYTHNYVGSLNTAIFEDFRVSSSLSTDNIREIYLANVSDIIENVYTFSAFTASTKLTLTACTLTEFNSSLPNTLVRFYIYNNYAPSTQYFNFNPTTNLALLPSFVELIISNTDMSGFTYDFSGSSSLQTLQLTSNNSLTNLNMTVPTGSSFFQFWVFGNTSLSALTVNNNLSDCINLNDIRVYGNTALTGWTYILPVAADNVQLNSNRIRNFDIDLSANTNLTDLNLNSNLVLSSFTNSISACTSLTDLRLDNNNLTTLPPIFPNSIQTLRLESNDITGYTSNFPTSCVYFDMSDSVASLQTVPQWSVDLTGATSLQTFNLNSVGLSGWTTQFPSSIKTISFRNNLLTDFDFNYTTGATSIDLYFNQLTGTTNLSGHTSLTGLTIGSNNFTDSSPILGGDFPPTLRTFDIGGSPLLTGWTTTFSAMTNMLSLNFQGTKLKTAAVDYILDDVATIAVANNLYNKTLNLSGTPPNQPESPTGGVTNADYILLTSSPYNWTVTITP
jgi:hypothetical protein